MIDINEKDMYGHLPYYQLFAKHQSEYMDQEDWKLIVKTIQENGSIRAGEKDGK